MWPYVPIATAAFAFVAGWLANLDPAWIALVGTLCGGVGLKIAEHWLGKNRIKVTDAMQIRDELRLTIAEQKTEIKSLEKESDEWQSKYYDLRDKYVDLQTQLTLAMAKIRSSTEEAEHAIEDIDKKPPPT